MTSLKRKMVYLISLLVLSVLTLLGISTQLLVQQKLNPAFRKFLGCGNTTNRPKVRFDNQGRSNFTNVFDNFLWSNFTAAIKQENREDIWTYVNDLIMRLTPYLTREPPIPINESCIIQPLRTKDQIECEKYNGTLSAYSEKKIGLLIQFGFEVDTLEIHLNELFDVVDIFFIIESTHTHSRFYRKPLIWERIKYQPRFQKFQSKIVYFLIDDASSITAMMKIQNSTDINSFASEDLQEKLRWKKFLEWNNATKFFNEEDLLGFGDSDEVASRETVNYLKHCVPESDPIDIGIWFPFGAIDQAYLSDFPVYEHPFTIGDPTFWTLKTAKDINTLAHFNLAGYPTRNRGRSAAHLLGGMHMTHYGYLPSILIKQLTLSESSYNYLKQVAELPLHFKNKDLEELQAFYREQYYKDIKYRILNLERVKIIDPEKEKIVVLPWFYNCNRDRYPSWERKLDPRLY